MMKKKYGFMIFIILLFTSGVNARAEKISLITDQFWNNMLEAELYQNPLEKFIKDARAFIPFFSSEDIYIDKKRLNRYTVEALGDDSDLEIIKELVKEMQGIIVLSPLFAVYGCELAEMFSDKSFIVPCVKQPSDCSSGNISFYVLDQSTAWYDAGRWAAGQKEPVFALFSTADELHRENNENFTEGWKKQRDINELDITVFSKSEELTEEFIEAYKARVFEAGGIAAVLAGRHNETVLGHFDGSRTRLLGEGLEFWPGTDFNAAGTVEHGPIKILSDIIIDVKADNYSNSKVIKAEFFLSDTE